MRRSHSWFFYLSALEGAAAIAALFLIPSEGGRLSPARLALIGFIFLICVACMALGIRRPQSVKAAARPSSIVLFGLLALPFGVSLFLLRYLHPESSLSAYQRLSPVLWYLLVLCIQSFFFLLILHKGVHPANVLSHKPVYRPAFVSFCVFVLLMLVIAFTRLGITPDPAYWGEPGVPLLGWQFALALLGGLGALAFTSSSRGRRLDLIVALLLYLAAVILWLSIPVEVLTNSFYMPINPPTFQPFPYSDAGYYDQMAHSLLIGHPYQGTIPTRPLYISLLAVLHRLFGENYQHIIVGQTLLLAAIPVLFYFLGKTLHSRVAGVTIALFFIFRELTTLMVSSNTRVSNTKTLLVDLPTLFLLILACLFALRWLKQKNERSALIAGGTFGLLLLLRTQSMLILPLLLVVALLVLGWRLRSAYFLAAVFLMGLVITVLPWLTHNYLQTGQFSFDAPFQYRVIASQYAYTGNLDVENFDLEGKGLGQVLLAFVLRDPAFVFGFIANHFLATQIHGLLVLPLIKPYPGLFAPVNLYWMEWSGQLEWYNLVLVIIYLAGIAIGLGTAWNRWRWIGWVPLVFSLGYALATAVGRFSGWRYDLPADWIGYFYFGIGVAELLSQAALLFGAGGDQVLRQEWREPIAIPQTRRASLVFIAGGFLLLGALPWLMKNMAPPRYAGTDPASLQANMAQVSKAPSIERVTTFLSEPESLMKVGRVLYPRFFGKENGLASANPWPSYAIRDYPRMGFVLLNQSNTYVVFPTKRIPEFPHAQDAIVLGCQREDYVEARWILFPALDAVYESETSAESCSP